MDTTRPVDPSLLADLPPAVAALKIEFREDGSRLIIHTEVCKLLRITPAGIRRLVERGTLERAEKSSSASWYRAEDVADLWRKRNPGTPHGASHSAPHVTPPIAPNEAVTLPATVTQGSSSEPALQALTEAIRTYVQSQANTIETMSATNLSIADMNTRLLSTNMELSQTCTAQAVELEKLRAETERLERERQRTEEKLFAQEKLTEAARRASQQSSDVLQPVEHPRIWSETKRIWELFRKP